jgi:hypothetical protein
MVHLGWRFVAAEEWREEQDLCEDDDDERESEGPGCRPARTRNDRCILAGARDDVMRDRD